MWFSMVCAFINNNTGCHSGQNLSSHYNHLAGGDYINYSLYLARKYARIFVRRHYLFRVVNYEDQLMAEFTLETSNPSWTSFSSETSFPS